MHLRFCGYLRGLIYINACLTCCTLLSEQSPPRPRITGVAHIAIFAHDFEKSRAFCREFLGFDEPYFLKNRNGSASMTCFKINERQYVELFPERAPRAWRSALSGCHQLRRHCRAFLAQRRG